MDYRIVERTSKFNANVDNRHNIKWAGIRIVSDIVYQHMLPHQRYLAGTMLHAQGHNESRTDCIAAVYRTLDKASSKRRHAGHGKSNTTRSNEKKENQSATEDSTVLKACLNIRRSLHPHKDAPGTKSDPGPVQ